MPKRAEYERLKKQGKCVECRAKSLTPRCSQCQEKTRKACMTKAQSENVAAVEAIIQEYQKDSATVSSKSPAIRTLDELLKAAKVDLSVWEVDRHEINQWQMARKNVSSKMVFVDGKASGYTDDRGGMHVEPLWQVKAWLRRRTPVETALSSLLKDISKNAPLLPKIRRIPVRSMGNRRSLEISIMDPHIGLLCGYPEADGPWDLDLAAQSILGALEDLIQKAEVFGPFEQCFMPFGNDWVHSDTVFHTTTAGTGQPESISWHRVYQVAQNIAVEMVERLRHLAPVFVYEVPGNHSRMADFTLARLLQAYFRREKDVTIDAGSSPYKFHRFGCNLVGYEHGHSVKPIRLAALMANERPDDWAATAGGYREWHLGDQHRKGSSKPSMLEEQGVSVEYIPGLTIPNEWHRFKSFNHQQRGAMAFVWDYHHGPLGRFQYNGNVEDTRKRRAA